MSAFEDKYEEWLQKHIELESNPRRRDLLEKGLGHGTVEFLREIWFPAVLHFDHLCPEWEVQDFHHGYRYVNLAYMPIGMKGGIEIQGFGPHTRDLDVRRFKDLCWRHSLLALDGWTLLPIAYLSIKEEPLRCRQLILSFIGKFAAIETPPHLSCLESETLRLARRLFRPLSPRELADHLRVSDQYARHILHHLFELEIMSVASGNKRRRTYACETWYRYSGDHEACLKS